MSRPGVPASRGLRAKIGNAFILQAAAISCATLLGVYASAAILEDVLIKRALIEETQHYLKRLELSPDAQAPDTHNMRAYLERIGARTAPAPPDLRGLAPGFHNLRQGDGQRPLVYVTDNKFGRLYLVFDQQHVAQLALFFGLVPMTLVLLFIYLASFAAYRLSKRAISPVIWLANEVSSWDPKLPDAKALAPDSIPLDIDGESRILGEALHSYSERIAELIERERTFTRDASHELRSPLTVIKLACEVLRSDTELDAYAERNIRRIESAAKDMEALIEAFLILAREATSCLPEEEFFINAVVRDECERAEPLLSDKPVKLILVEQAQLRLHAPNKIIAVMVGNLIRNACSYTDAGTVTVTVGAQGFSVQDTGCGMSADDLAQSHRAFFRSKGSTRGGQGVGLTIVRRLSDRFGWPVQLRSQLGVGTCASIQFPDAEVLCAGTAQAEAT